MNSGILFSASIMPGTNPEGAQHLHTFQECGSPWEMDWTLVHLLNSNGATPWEGPAANPSIHLCSPKCLIFVGRPVVASNNNLSSRHLLSIYYVPGIKSFNLYDKVYANLSLQHTQCAICDQSANTHVHHKHSIHCYCTIDG